MEYEDFWEELDKESTDLDSYVQNLIDTEKENDSEDEEFFNELLMQENNVQEDNDYEIRPLRSNGSIAETHNNPGNIKFGNFAKNYGAVPGKQATDGGVFAVFPDIQTGLKAREDLLQGNSYKNLTVNDAMKKWSNSGYDGDIVTFSNKKIKDLTQKELDELTKNQIKREDGNLYRKLFKSQYGTNDDDYEEIETTDEYGNPVVKRVKKRKQFDVSYSNTSDNLNVNNTKKEITKKSDKKEESPSYNNNIDFPDTVNKILSYGKNHLSNITSAIDTTMDLGIRNLTNLQNIDNELEMQRRINKDKYFPENQTITNVPIYT